MVQGAVLSAPVASRHGIFFWLFGNVVSVRYTFFLTAMVMGMGRRTAADLLSWVIVAFAAVLLHELGHAAAARAYGQTPHIELHAMGGTTHRAWDERVRWRRRVAIALSGPAIGLAVGGLVAVLTPHDPGGPRLLHMARHDFLWVTVGWSLFNLLPLLPMDGGLALAETLEWWRGADKGRLLARQVSCVTGAIGLMVALSLNQVWAAALCGVFTYDNLQRMRGLPGVELPR